MPTLSPTVEICTERFWSKIKKAGPDECWEWQAGLNYLGYGQMCWCRKMRSTHRLSYEINVGPIPAGMEVCHRCDNRKCVNPAHLWLGTHKENMLDMAAKGRASGPRNRKPRTHCKSGHILNESTTKLWGKRKAVICLICHPPGKVGRPVGWRAKPK